jgi:hypothetical protein
MSTPKLNTAVEALEAVLDSARDPIGLSAPFICPYPECGAYAQHFWGVVDSLSTYPASNRRSDREISDGVKLVAAMCSVCAKEVIFLDQKMVVPAVSQAPAPGADLPPDLADDFEEARRVLPISPRGSAALLRLVVQKLLPLIGAKESDINKMIGELVAKGTVSSAIQQALDSVRVIGNEAVHPGTMDLRDDQSTAISLFKLINFIVEKAITQPREVEVIYAGLPPQKLAGIASRDKPKA